MSTESLGINLLKVIVSPACQARLHSLILRSLRFGGSFWRDVLACLLAPPREPMKLQWVVMATRWRALHGKLPTGCGALNRHQVNKTWSCLLERTSGALTLRACECQSDG